jgi:hypothetical protein
VISLLSETFTKKASESNVVEFAWGWRHLIGALITLLIAAPLAYFAADRTPPWKRLSGEIEPVHAGDQLTVHWHTTEMVRACPGTVQVEIISGRLIWPTLAGQVTADEKIVGRSDYTPPPWPVDQRVPPGTATYRVTTHWYCNWLQSWLDWPIEQIGPDVPFTVLPRR